MASRYRRVNIDGQSLFRTETRTTAAALLPGTAAIINGEDVFAQATALTGRLYIIDCAYHQGLGIRDVVPEGDSAVGNYVEEGRELALLCVPGAYKKDSQLGGFADVQNLHNAHQVVNDFHPDLLIAQLNNLTVDFSPELTPPNTPPPRPGAPPVFEPFLASSRWPLTTPTR